MASVFTAAAVAACPVCALNDSARGDAQWWVVFAALLVPFAVAGLVALAIRRVLRAEKASR